MSVLYIAMLGGVISAFAALAAMGEDMYEYQDAVDLVKDGKLAALGTSDKGQPFVSLTPYALDANGRPFVYISTMAFHTKNLKAKPESSLMVAKADEENLFNSARLTFVGKMTLVTDKDEVDLQKIYFDKYPEAKDLAKAHEFGFYRMEVEKLHYIGGFGDVHWIKGSDWSKGYK